MYLMLAVSGLYVTSSKVKPRGSSPPSTETGTVISPYQFMALFRTYNSPVCEGVRIALPWASQLAGAMLSVATLPGLKANIQLPLVAFRFGWTHSPGTISQVVRGLGGVLLGTIDQFGGVPTVQVSMAQVWVLAVTGATGLVPATS